jgi:hypothetical protein
MLLRQFARLLVVSLLTFLAVLPAVAARPMIVDVNEVIVDEFLTEACGFPVEISTTGTLIVRSRDGTVATTGANFQRTFTNLESGTSFTLRASGLDQFSSTDTGFTFSFSGGARIVIPGQGAVFIDAGRTVGAVTFDPDTGEVIDNEIVRRGRADNFSVEQICALLEP